MSLEKKIGQMLAFAYHGTEFNDQLASFISEFHLGGIVYFRRNIKDIYQVATLNQRLQKETAIP